MRSTARTPAAVIVLALGLLFTGCPDKTIRLGAVVPRTGDDDPYGKAIERGLTLAYEEIQNDSTYSTLIDFTIVDSESDPEVARERLREQYSDGALAVIGGVTSDEVQAMLEVVDRYDRVLLSPSATSPELTGVSRNFYRICPSDYSAANKMADFAGRNLGLKSAVVIAERTYGKGIQGVFESSFQKNEGEVLEVIELPPGTSDFGGIVERVVTLKPDAVYLAAYEAGISAMIRELRKNNFKGRILTTSAFATSSAIADVGQDAKDVVLTMIFLELDSEYAHVKRFVESFEAKYGEKPDLYAAYGYDALKVMAAAVDGRPSLPGEVHKGLRDAVKEFPGVTGSIQFTDKGDVQKYPRIYVVGEDLALYDYTERIQRQQKDLKRRREELRKKLEQLHDQAGG